MRESNAFNAVKTETISFGHNLQRSGTDSQFVPTEIKYLPRYKQFQGTLGIWGIWIKDRTLFR
jgi:hypothetical protein